MSDDLCTSQGVVFSSARKCSAEAQPSAKSINQSKGLKASEGLKASDDLCNHSAEARLDSRRNLFSRVMAPNHLMTYVPVKASYLVEHETIPQKPA